MRRTPTPSQAGDGDRVMLLERIVAAVARAPGFERGLQDALDVTVEALGLSAGGIVLCERDDTLRLVCRCGLPAEDAGRLVDLRPDDPGCRALRRGEPLLRDRALGDHVPEGFACTVTVPLGDGDGVFGAMSLGTRDARELSPELVTLLLAVGRTAGELVLRMRAEEAVRDLNRGLEALLDERTAALAAADAALRAEVGERRRAEQELRQSEERYRHVFDLEPDALLVVDAATLRILDANQSATVLYGSTRDELLDMDITALSADAAAAGGPIAAPDAPGTHVSLRRHRRRDGSEFPAEVTATTLSLAGRTVITQAVRDVTYRERREAYTTAVAEIQRSLLAAGDSPSHETLYDLVLPQLLSASGADHVYVFENEVDDLGRSLGSQRAEVVRPGIAAQIDNPRLQRQPYDLLGPEWEGRLRDGAPVIGRAAEFNEYSRVSLEEQGIRAVLILPLLVSGQLFGMIGFDNCTDDRLWDFVEIALLTTAAAALSAALERHRAFTALRTRTGELSALLHTSRAIAASIDYDEVLREVARGAGEVLCSPECIIWEHDAAHHHAEFRCLWEADPKPGLADSLRGTWYDVTTHEGGLRGLRSGEVKQQSRSDPGISAQDADDMDRFGEKTWLTVPLVVADDLIGVMILIESAAERDFSEDERRMAAAIGEQAAVALSNARLHRRAEERNRWLQALVETSRAIASTLDTDQLLTNVARLAAEAVRSPIAFIYEYDRARDVIITRSRFGPEGLGRDDPIGTVFEVDNAPDDRRALEGGEVFVETLSDPGLHPFARGEMESTGEKTLVNVPFRFQGEPLGMMVLVETEAERVFTSDELEFLAVFGEQVAIAFNNARLYATIAAQATLDGLTGLANHRTFYERLAQELTRAQRYATPVSLLMIDIDDFKLLNDTCGHQAGDEVLRQLGSLLAGQLRRDVDLPARYGGEEFAVILPNTSVARALRRGGRGAAPADEAPPEGHGEGAEALAERLRALVASTDFPVGDAGRVARLTVSIGVATFPDMVHNMDDLVACADAALYAAKRAGKDLVQVYRQ